ncbi:MAG TPA: protein kinase [Solimonas sp.]|nr:protein kinase [Solimonas sp.]
MTRASPVGPQHIGRFEVERLLGHGSQGEVYLASDPRLGRRVAIKTLRPSTDRGASLPESLMKEARTAGALAHPNIVPVFECGAFGASPFVVFEYVPGQTLKHLLASQGKLTAPAAVVMMSQILAGMAHAHAAGVVHGDLSPANILIASSGAPRVTDFGIAAMLNERRPAGAALTGTLRYMAPERFQGQPAAARGDVFALGLLFHEMLAGAPAFAADSEYGLIYKLLYEPTPLPSQHASGIDPALDAIVLRALEKDPARRYADAGEMKQAVDRIRVATAAAGSAPLQQEAVHGTVDFLLRRMRHKSDFPALSHRLAEINRMTADDSPASVRQLTNFVVQDFALTSKLLRLANQANTGRSGVTSISVAIRLLGLSQLRVIATGLLLAAPAEQSPRDPQMLEAISGAFVAGVIGWHLGRLAQVDGPEELFLCSMFSRLGEMLTIHYFPDEYAEIRRRLCEGAPDEAAVVRDQLGLGYEELGVEIARHWNFPETILRAQVSLPPGPVPAARNRGERLAHCAGLARELCQLARRRGPLRSEEALAALLARYADAVPCTREQLRPLLQIALGVAQQYCRIAGIEGRGGDLIDGLEAWCKPPARAVATTPAA